MTLIKQKNRQRFDSLKMSYQKPNNALIIGGDGAKDSTVDSQEKESLIFFFHPDHLGSTSYVTGADGTVAQHVEYIPYGEVFVEERNSSFLTSYLFNAKELDDETGMYYYGARYLDPTNAMWISVDPMWEKFAGMSAYNYCAGNPVKMVDPDGRNTKVIIDPWNSTISVHCNIILTGGNATPELARKYENAVMSTWGSMKEYKYGDKTYSINWKVKITANPDLKDNIRKEGGTLNYMKVFDKINSKKSYNSYVHKTWDGEIRKNGIEDSNPMPHEFGHMLGLRDKYVTEEQAQKVGSKWKNTTLLGWEGNIMGEPAGKGVVENKNLDILFAPMFKEHNSKDFSFFFNSEFNTNENRREPKFDIEIKPVINEK